MQYRREAGISRLWSLAVLGVALLQAVFIGALICLGVYVEGPRFFSQVLGI